MRALTLWRPWAYAFLVGGKLIENRSWAPPIDADGGLAQDRILLHNSKVYDAEGARFIEAVMGHPVPDSYAPAGFPDLLEAGRLFAVVRVAGAIHLPTAEVRPGMHPETEEGIQTACASPWAFGPWCWVLEDLRPVAGPIVRGGQGLWRPSLDALKACAIPGGAL